MSIVRPRLALVLAIACTALAALAPANAGAATVTYQTATSCDTHTALTDWTHQLQLPKFDQSLGTFVSATVSQEVSVTSAYRVESRDGAPRIVTLELVAANVASTVPGVGTIATNLMPGSRTYSFTAFDGTVDFAGSSGASGNFGTAAQTGVDTSTNAALWTGPGTVAVVAGSTASTTQSQSGNLRLEWDTTSTVRACVTYTYTVEVLVCIGDYVWHDSDVDGIQDSGEEPVAGRPVTVTDSNGKVLGTTTTDQAGRWIQCGLEPSTACVVSVDLPAGWTVTTPLVGPDRAVDSDGIATASGDATISCITPPSGRDLTFDVGIHQPPTPVDSPPPTPARLRLTKASNVDAIASRGQVAFTVRVTNRGQRAVRNLRVCDTPPSQLAFVSRPRGSSMRSGQLCWTVRALAGGKTVTYRYVMRAANVADRTCVVNRATAVAGVGGSASARDSVCIRATRLGVLQLAG